MISRIERGEVHASAVVLDKLCAGLGLTLSALFARETPSPLMRRKDQPVWQDPDSGYLRREVAPTGTGSPVRIVQVDFPPGAEVIFDASREHALEQYIWVLKGEIEASVGSGPGAVTHHLSKGDCLYMRLAAGNSFRNSSGKPARYAVILTQDLPA
jgi:quercetin dioxygenase-like cupin family protein